MINSSIKKAELFKIKFQCQIWFGNVKSSRPEVFCKEGVLTNFEKNHRKTPVPNKVCHFNKVAGL